MFKMFNLPGNFGVRGNEEDGGTPRRSGAGRRKSPVKHPAKDVRDYAMDLLGRRPYSEAELRCKLISAGYPPAAADDALVFCREHKFTDDAAFAEDLAAGMAFRRLGQRRIEKELVKRGIPAELRVRMLDGLASGEEERASAALADKLRLIPDETDIRRKYAACFRFLMSRGFSGEICRRVISNAFDSGC